MVTEKLLLFSESFWLSNLIFNGASIILMLLFWIFHFGLLKQYSTCSFVVMFVLAIGQQAVGG